MRKGVFVFLLIFVGVVVLSGFVSAACYEIRDANGVDTHFEDRVKFLEAAKDAPFGCTNFGDDDRHCYGYSDCNILEIEGEVTGPIIDGTKILNGCTYDFEKFSDGFDEQGNEIVKSNGVETNVANNDNECACVFEGAGGGGGYSGWAEGPVRLLEPFDEICDDYTSASCIISDINGNYQVWEKELDENNNLQKTGRICEIGGSPSFAPGFGTCTDDQSGQIKICAIGSSAGCVGECHYAQLCTTEYYEESDIYGNKKQTARKYFHKIEPKVSIILDPSYVDDATAPVDEAGRGFRPTRITPFDNIICKARVPISGNDMCNLRFVDMTFEGELILYSGVSSPYPVESIKTGTLTGGKVEDGHYVYEWPIQGWASGWTGDSVKMEKIVKTIKEGGSIGCEVTKEIGDMGVAEGVGFSDVSLCVQLQGSGKIKVVNKRGESSGLTPFGIIEKGNGNVEGGFNAIDPFMTYKESFKHYVDLEKYDDGSLLPPNTSEILFHNLRLASQPGNCGLARLNNFYTRKGGVEDRLAYTYFLSSAILLYPPVPPQATIHETGHALSFLRDEYVINNPHVSLDFNGANCAQFPLGGWRWYGEHDDLGCSLSNYYRPSHDSIMRSGLTNNKFNVASCGQVVKSIVGGSLTEHRDQCCTLGVVDPPHGFVSPHGCP